MTIDSINTTMQLFRMRGSDNRLTIENKEIKKNDDAGDLSLK